MIIKLKNKDTLKFGNFKIKCAIGLGGLKKNKLEGDKSTPRGLYKLGDLYWRPDRLKKPVTKLKCIRIKKNMGWCNDIKSKYYNKRIFINKKYRHEKLFRRDHKYDCLIVVKYNYQNTIKGIGSAIFIHLTKNYKKTAGCIALKKNDFLVLAKIINNKTKINLN